MNNLSILPQVGILYWMLPGSQQLPMLCFEETLLSHDLRVQYFIDTEEHQQVTPQCRLDFVMCPCLLCIFYFDKMQSLSKPFRSVTKCKSL